MKPALGYRKSCQKEEEATVAGSKGLSQSLWNWTSNLVTDRHKGYQKSRDQIWLEPVLKHGVC